MILDTAFLSHLIDERQEAWDKAVEIHEDDFDKNITPVILFELYYGAFADENEDLIRKIGNISLMYNMEQMDEEAILEGAKRLANADLVEGGDSGVEQRDGMIAGVAATHDETILTEDVDDFEKLDVVVEEFSVQR